MPIICLAGINLDDIKQQFNRANNAYVENITSITNINETYTTLPSIFNTYDSPEWNIQFNLRCAFCDKHITSRPKFIPTKIDSDGTMYTHGAFCKFVCIATYLDESKYLNQNLILNVYYLYKIITGRSPISIPKATDRLTLCLYGGNVSEIEYYKNLERLESEIICS